MRDWWVGLSLREKGLLGTAGAILLVLVIWYGVVTPMTNAREEARLARQTASNELAQLERLLAAQRAMSPLSAAPGNTNGQSLSGDAFKSEVTRSAQAAGLSIARLQGGDGGPFSLVFEQADARQLYYWLGQVETSLGGSVERMSIDQAPNGRVRATVDVVAGGS
ncbi:type II secretion system protein GspM [Henriciella litoralis]|uniref:type II secretion system protein GspM n=1 Tax=Henriciella litoralis TaxID=568102 RepID=UPI0009FC8E4A|nr:type II secretion system protein M [Henriciella litoralis]